MFPFLIDELYVRLLLVELVGISMTFIMTPISLFVSCISFADALNEKGRWKDYKTNDRSIILKIERSIS